MQSAGFKVYKSVGEMRYRKAKSLWIRLEPWTRNRVCVPVHHTLQLVQHVCQTCGRPSI